MIIKHTKNGKYPLVLLHGWGLNSAVWDFVLPQLEQWFDVIRIDLPGFGVNHQHGPSQYSVENLARKIAPYCPDDSIVVGWSLGGLVGAQMALEQPQKVTSLCLVASTPCFVEQDLWKGIKPQVLQQFVAQLSEDREKTVERFLAIQAMGSATVRQDVKQLKQALNAYPKASEAALAGGLQILKSTDLRQAMTQLTMPVKGIFGRLDALVAIKSIEQWAGSLPDFEYKVVHKASHAPFISHRTEFIEHLYEMYQGQIRS